MAESSSSPSSDVVSSCPVDLDAQIADLPREEDGDIVISLQRAANLVRSGAADSAERENQRCLEQVGETALPLFALQVISLVRTLDLASLVVGPLPPLETDQIVRTVSTGRSGPRRDYAHAIVTAVRVRLHAFDGGRREVA